MSKMNQEIKQKWLKALRSGEYKQGAGGLKRIHSSNNPSGKNTFSYCCLGVLSEICGIENEAVKLDTGTLFSGIYYFKYPMNCKRLTNMPPAIWLKSVGISDYVGDELAEMNDDGMPFIKIADWIEENL